MDTITVTDSLIRSAPSPWWPPGRGARRLRAARIARLLLPVGTHAGGFVSTQVRVRLPDGRLARPDVAFACREPPPDGLLDSAPDLVVTLRPEPQASAEAAVWLAAGSAAAWCVGVHRVMEHLPAAEPRARLPGEGLGVPGLGAAVPVAGLLA